MQVRFSSFVWHPRSFDQHGPLSSSKVQNYELDGPQLPSPPVSVRRTEMTRDRLAGESCYFVKHLEVAAAEPCKSHLEYLMLEFAGSRVYSLSLQPHLPLTLFWFEGLGFWICLHSACLPGANSCTIMVVGDLIFWICSDYSKAWPTFENRCFLLSIIVRSQNNQIGASRYLLLQFEFDEPLLAFQSPSPMVLAVPKLVERALLLAVVGPMFGNSQCRSPYSFHLVRLMVACKETNPL